MGFFRGLLLLALIDRILASIGVVLRPAPLPQGARRQRPSPPPKPRKRPWRKPKAVVEVDCPACARALVFTHSDMIDLAGPEVALVVRELKSGAGQALAEYVCPYCDASHIFAGEPSGVRYLGTNLYTPGRYIPPEEKFKKTW